MAAAMRYFALISSLSYQGGAIRLEQVSVGPRVHNALLRTTIPYTARHYSPSRPLVLRRYCTFDELSELSYCLVANPRAYARGYKPTRSVYQPRSGACPI